MDGITKAIDLLKASGWQCLMLSVGAWAFVWASKAGHVPPLDGGWLLLAYVFAFATAALALAAVGTQISRFGRFLLEVWKAWYRKRAAQRRFRQQIGYLDEQERRIFGYLLHHKMKAFEVAIDGGYANKLIAQGFIVRIAQAGQVFGMDDMPVKVPEYIWEEVEERREAFPKPKDDTYPWRVPWQFR